MKIVYGTDLSLEAMPGAKLCSWIVDAYADDDEVSVQLVHAVPPPRRSYGQTSALADDPDNLRRIKQGVRKWIEENIENADSFDVFIDEGHPAEILEEQVLASKANYLVLGQTGKGAFARMMLGSTSHQIAQDPPCKLLLAHREFPNFVDLERICVAVDFEAPSGRVLKAASDLARHFSAGISVIHAYAPPVTPTFGGPLINYTVDENAAAQAEEIAERQMTEFLDEYSDALEGLEVQSAILQGTPTRQIVDFAANSGADILCLGTRRSNRPDYNMLGTIASGVVRHMPTTVLLVPPTNRWEK